MRRKMMKLIVCTAGALSLLGGASAQATTVTLGSPLPSTLVSGTIGGVATISQTALPGATLTSPFNGTITSWKVVGAAGGPWFLQVVHPVGGGLFTSTGSASSGPITGTGVLSFPTSLPIKAGDQIGLRPTAAADKLGVSAVTAGTSFQAWLPPLVDGTAARAPTSSTARELGFNATVESNCVVPKLKGKSLKKAKKALVAANCTKGKVKRPRHSTKFVRKQNPAAGTEVPGGTAVALKLRPEK